MAIQVASFLIPKGGNSFFIIEDKYVKGGLQVAATVADRDAIISANRKFCMLVLVQADKKIWQLESDLITWTEFKIGSGPIRVSATYSTAVLAPGASENFDLPIGRTAIVLKLVTDSPCKVQAFSTVTRDETNPFTFISTPGHLEDDGSTLMTDGSTLRGRKHSILSNGEPGTSNAVYFTITNTDTALKNIILSISYLPIEI